MSHCYWQSLSGDEYEIHYRMDGEEIADWSLYPKPDFVPTREDERDIFELIYDDARGENEL